MVITSTRSALQTIWPQVAKSTRCHELAKLSKTPKKDGEIFRNIWLPHLDPLLPSSHIFQKYRPIPYNTGPCCCSLRYVYDIFHSRARYSTFLLCKAFSQNTQLGNIQALSSRIRHQVVRLSLSISSQNKRISKAPRFNA